MKRKDIQEINLYNDDCIKILKKLKDNTVDLIIADPPYVISTPSQFHTMKDRKNPRKGTDLGAWDKEFDNNAWIKLAYNKLKKGGSLICFNDLKKASYIIDIANKNKLIYKDTLIWNKTNPMPRNRDRRYVQDIELIQWFVKPKEKWTFNRQKENFESCVKVFPSESGGGYKRIHPTQKPLKLIENIIEIHSNIGDLIVDPFSGSGSTMICAKKLGRSFYGSEIDKNYYEKSIKRYDEIFSKSN